MSVKRELIIGKAEPVGDRPLPDLHILVAGALPERSVGTLAGWDVYCDNQARELEEALVSALPGAIYDRLLGRMLGRRASQFYVSHKSFEQGAIA